MDYTFWVAMHSGIRWLIILAFVLVLVKYLLGVVGNSQYAAIDKSLLSVFSTLTIVQFLLGLVIIIWRTTLGPVPAQVWAHLLVMIIAVGVVASTGGRTRRAVGDALKFRTGLIGTLISAVIILLGVTVVGGWS